MAKLKMLCPISKTACIDCPIYRGRHFYLCFSNGYQDALIEKDQLKQLKSSIFGKKETEKLSFDVPEDLRKIDLKCIHNVEDVVFEKEFKK
ncbi:MAG TPA: hypothetical protein PK800_00530 [Syntrophorhabdaceae bacterium]|nr:hypothetical protein [Syntrophorhabdaceae bacterium]